MAFRWSAQQRAEELGLSGWVRNLPDGRVEAWVEGDASTVEQMLTWLRDGPRGAHVENMTTTDEAPIGASPPFHIRA